MCWQHCLRHKFRVLVARFCCYFLWCATRQALAGFGLCEKDCFVAGSRAGDAAHYAVLKHRLASEYTCMPTPLAAKTHRNLCENGCMNDIETDWEARVAALWTHVNTLSPTELVGAIDALAAERPADDAAALFERAAARDTAGLESNAEVFYRQALATDCLDPYRRARAVIQLASTLRILGQLEESERLLTAELVEKTWG